MQRQTIIISLTVQFQNPVQPPQWDAPVMLTQASLVVDAGGQPVYPPAFSQVPAASSDITDDMLAHLQVQLAAVGLTVARTADGA